MLGGTTITDRTREHAREMLAAARQPGAPPQAGSPLKAGRASGGKDKPRARSGRAG
jgi:hypothetical protein